MALEFVLILLVLLACFVLFYGQHKKNEHIGTLKKSLDYEKLPKVLYLVIYNENTDYERKMKKVLDKYVNNFNHIKTYFIMLKNLDGNKEYEICGNIVYFNGEESLRPGVLDKTIRAMRLLGNSGEYDYILRSNISTVIDLMKLTAVLQNIKGTNIYGISCLIIKPEKHDSKYIIAQSSQGTGIILDKIAVKYLLDNIHKFRFDPNTNDDIAIGVMMYYNRNVKKVKIPGHFIVKPNNIYDYIYNIIMFPIIDPEYIIFYRNKTDNRYNDIKTMNGIINYLLKC